MGTPVSGQLVQASAPPYDGCTEVVTEAGENGG